VYILGSVDISVICVIKLSVNHINGRDINVYILGSIHVL